MRERPGEPSRIAATRNHLSGATRTAAQAGTVYGGIHMYQSPPRTNRWLHATSAVLTVITGITISTLVRSPSTGGIVAGTPIPQRSELPVPATDTAARPPGKGIEHVPPTMSVPPRLNAATTERWLNIPEPAVLRSFQSFRCNDNMYARVNVVSLEIERLPAEPPAIARHFADRLIEQFWDGPVAIRYHRPRNSFRTSPSHAVYIGIHIEATISALFPVACGSSNGVVKGIMLDHGNTYFLAFVIACLDGDPYYAPIPTEREVDLLLDSIQPAS